MNKQGGLTMIELLLAVAVIAILAVTIIFVLNPLAIIEEARDSQRIADVAQMKEAVSLYLASGKERLGDCSKCYAYVPDDSVAVGDNCGGRHSLETVTSTSRAVDGTGWVPIDLTSLNTGSPLAVWPIDPGAKNTTGDFFYTYACNEEKGTFEFTVNLESERFGHVAGAPAGANDIEANDGGDQDDIYEVGSDECLNL